MCHCFHTPDRRKNKGGYGQRTLWFALRLSFVSRQTSIAPYSCYIPYPSWGVSYYGDLRLAAVYTIQCVHFICDLLWERNYENDIDNGIIIGKKCIFCSIIYEVLLICTIDVSTVTWGKARQEFTKEYIRVNYMHFWI